jgi:hypothetical protein
MKDESGNLKRIWAPPSMPGEIPGAILPLRQVLSNYGFSRLDSSAPRTHAFGAAFVSPLSSFRFHLSF